MKDTVSESRANLIDMLSHRMGLSDLRDLITVKPTWNHLKNSKHHLSKLMDPTNPNQTESWKKAVKDIVLYPVGLETEVVSINESRNLSNVALAHADAKTVLPMIWSIFRLQRESISMNIKD
ncbi:hypothetical protein HDV02_004065 [Globomyces sp. JEL0801]|nr:hypothetical protein HDV02_004065 [Globomyces sp. JEL0801]